MLLSPRKNGLFSLFKEVRVFKDGFKTLRFRGPKGKRPMRFGKLRAKTQRIQLRFAI